MNQKRQRFVEAFVGEAAGNASKAAILAGYSPNGAGQTAHKLLKEAEIAHAIAERSQALSLKADITAERIIQETADVAFTKTDIKGNDKMKALELLGKYRQLWQDKSEAGASRITVNIGYLTTSAQPVTIDVQAITSPSHATSQK